MLMDVQSFWKHTAKKGGERITMFSLQGRCGVWYSGHFLLFSTLHTFFFHEYALLSQLGVGTSGLKEQKSDSRAGARF